VYKYVEKQEYSFAPFRGKEFLKEYFESRKEVLEKLESKFDFPTSKHKQNILEQFAIDYLLKQYEVKKEIPDTSLETYAYITIGCLETYEKTLNLKYLNCALKINDMICSKINKLKTAWAIYFSYIALYKEKVIIERILKRENINP